jgi:hypothetical protein
MTKEQLEAAEEAIDRYRYHMTGKQAAEWRNSLKEIRKK